jgi:HK97 family phage major capsid protein
MINAYQLNQQLAEVRERAQQMMNRIQGAARAEGRLITAQEKAAIQTIVDEGNALKARLEKVQGDASMSAAIDNLTSGMTPVSMTRPGVPFRGGNGGSLGSQFINSDTYRWLRDTASTRAGKWEAPASELGGDGGFTLHATTLDTTSGSGGALVLPDTRPGIVMLPTRPLVVADLVAPGTTDSNIIQFMKETTFTNAAAAVAQGGTKPESTLVFAASTSPVQKIAHWIPVTEEMLEDVAQVQSYVDTRLRTGVLLTEDLELLSGTGVAPHLLGFTALPGIAAPIARVAEVNADTLLSQFMAIWTSVQIQPDGIVMNPAQWRTILLTKDTTGQYYGGGPFASPHAPTLWGLPVALTTAITAGTALIGCFKSCAQLFRRGALRVEASNSHSDFFVKNLVAIRAEERLALAVYRESAFGLVTNLN